MSGDGWGSILISSSASTIKPVTGHRARAAPSLTNVCSFLLKICILGSDMEISEQGRKTQIQRSTTVVATESTALSAHHRENS
jgi:hypothetical protein